MVYLEFPSLSVLDKIRFVTANIERGGPLGLVRIKLRIFHPVRGPVGGWFGVEGPPRTMPTQNNGKRREATIDIFS